MRNLLLGSVFAAAMFLSTNANATLISIGLQQAGFNGGAITTVATDGGSGVAVYSGNYGTFMFNTITAQGSPAQNMGSLSTTSIQTTNADGIAGTISIYITASGQTSPFGLTSFLSGFTSNAFTGSAVSVVESTLYSNADSLYSGTQLASNTFSAVGGTVSTDTAMLSGVYSETAKFVVTVGAGRASVNDTIVLTATAVPEPASLVLVGAGLIGIGVARSRKNRAAA